MLIRLKTIMAFLFMGLVCLCVNAEAATQTRTPAQPAAKAGSEVKTEYFQVKIPDGWMLVQPVSEVPQGISAVFAATNNKLAVTLNVMRGNIPAKDIAAQTAQNMKKTGLTTSDPVEVNGLQKIDLSGKAKGQAWFGSNGEVCTVTIIMGIDIPKANELLSVLQPVAPGLFPKSID